jgi:hypothetical protein
MTRELRRLHAAERALEKAQERLGAAAFEYAKAETLKLSKRWPSRLVEYHSGMGRTTLFVSRRGPMRGSYMFSDTYGDVGAWVPPFIAELARVEDDTRLPDPGAGSVKARNGVEQ